MKRSLGLHKERMSKSEVFSTICNQWWPSELTPAVSSPLYGRSFTRWSLKDPSGLVLCKPFNQFPSTRIII